MPSLRPRTTPAVPRLRERLPRMAKRAREDEGYRYDSESDFSPEKKLRKSPRGILYQRLNPSRRAKTVADRGILAILAASSDEETPKETSIVERSALDLLQHDSGLSETESANSGSKTPDSKCQELVIVIDSDSDEFADLPDLIEVSEDEYSDLPDLISDSEL